MVDYQAVLNKVQDVEQKVYEVSKGNKAFYRKQKAMYQQLATKMYNNNILIEASINDNLGRLYEAVVKGLIAYNGNPEPVITTYSKKSELDLRHMKQNIELKLLYHSQSLPAVLNTDSNDRLVLLDYRNPLEPKACTVTSKGIEFLKSVKATNELAKMDRNGLRIKLEILNTDLVNYNTNLAKAITKLLN